MLNVIFSMIDIRWTLSEEQENTFRKQIDFVRPLPESRKIDNRIMYQANVKDFWQLEEMKAILQRLDDPQIIWIWDIVNWLQQGYKYNEDLEVIRKSVYNEETWEEENEVVYYPFNLEQYTYYLNDIVEYNENFEEVSRRRPTKEEAQATQVNKFAWMPDRDLNIYI